MSTIFNTDIKIVITYFCDLAGNTKTVIISNDIID